MTTSANEIDLYDEKGSCQICSSSTVQRRVEKGEYTQHARRHIEAGDPVKIYQSAGVRRANRLPDMFKVITE